MRPPADSCLMVRGFSLRIYQGGKLREVYVKDLEMLSHGRAI